MLKGIVSVCDCRRNAPSGDFWLPFIGRSHGLEVQPVMRQRMWESTHVRLAAVTVDTDTAVHTLFGHQMGASKGYNPKHKGDRSADLGVSGRDPVVYRGRTAQRTNGAQIAVTS